jgi:hypothetical protein
MEVNGGKSKAWAKSSWPSVTEPRLLYLETGCGDAILSIVERPEVAETEP